jgi:hypothetical protein
MSFDSLQDPRTRLVRQKFFTLRPQPLERWLWKQGIPASAERVFWLHWQEGMQRGDWCSEIPLKRVASECQVDLSTVTRAYQSLLRIGCIRRTDPGRDAANPFQQAISVTEVRLPNELLKEMAQHPNRRTANPSANADRAGQGMEASALHVTKPPVQCPPKACAAADPFSGLRGRERIRALTRLTQLMSEPERRSYREAQQSRNPAMVFETNSQLSASEQGQVLQLLTVLASSPESAAPTEPADRALPAACGQRRLSTFELARLKRGIQIHAAVANTPELLRQAAWSIEEGALARFSILHALNIAIKKIREGTWTRPNRMPPNWLPRISFPAATLEACSHA